MPGQASPSAAMIAALLPGLIERCPVKQFSTMPCQQSKRLGKRGGKFVPLRWNQSQSVQNSLARW